MGVCELKFGVLNFQIFKIISAKWGGGGLESENHRNKIGIIDAKLNFPGGPLVIVFQVGYHHRKRAFKHTL